MRLAADRDSQWVFWVRWYEGFLDGRPLDWEMQERIAVTFEPRVLIAELVREIEQERKTARSESARRHAAYLKARSKLTATVATGLSAQIRVALDAYRREVSNALPDALDPLQRLPSLLDALAMRIVRDVPEDEIAQLIVAMADTIGELNKRLSKTRAELASRPSYRPVRTIIRDGFFASVGGLAAATLFAPEVWGFILSGSAEILDPSNAGSVETLGNCYDELVGPEAIFPPDLWGVPDYSET